jgi:sortase (surface protein transpeptidase)
MRRSDAGRGVLTATFVVLSTIGVAGSQPTAAASTAGQSAPVALGEPPAVQSFRSVRTYREVAEPARLRIPTAGVDTRLLRLGRTVDRSIEVPAEFGVAGWFAEGPRPGQAGPAVILGHVDSRKGPAVFFRLADLAPGAEVAVDRADGSTVEFRVTRVLRVSKAAFPTDLVYGPTLEPSLRLVTCGGSFDRATRNYRDNVIVYADPAR